jgi:acyl-CoA thioester hydrolase
MAGTPGSALRAVRQTPVRCYARVSDFKFANDLRVRFAETDAQGIAHHSAFVVWFEATRIEYLRRFRGGYLTLREEDGVDALTLEVYARYKEAARFDDRLTIKARCSNVRGARFRFDYEVERDGVPVADGWTTHACVSVDGHRPTRVPTWLVDAITEAEN